MYIHHVPEPTEKEVYVHTVRIRLRKAQHLSERMRNFLADLETSKIKKADKDKIKEELMKFMK
jgi:hypothetical protein